MDHLNYQSKWWWKILYKAGIDIVPGAPRKFLIYFRKRFFYIAGSILLFVFISLLGLAKYSESPSFCHSCHIMEPYYKAWKGSKHNMVACVECHYPPGTPKTILWKKFQALSQVVKYITRTYSSKPFAEVEDSSCLQCHSTRLLEGKLVTAKGVQFDHKAHLTTTRRDRKLVCTSCHAQMVVGNHMEVTWNTCYLCHFKGMVQGRELHPIGGCLGCHKLPDKDFKIGVMTYNHKDFSGKMGVACSDCHQDVIQGKGDASQERCFTCHNQPEKLKKINDIPFIHENHITKHNVACFHCHTEMQHKVSMPGKKELAYDCSVCHLSKHTGQKDFYRGIGAKEVPQMPSPMYLANVDCVGCHISKPKDDMESHFKGKTFKGAEEESCVKCHGKKYKGITKDAKVVISKELNEVKNKWTQAKVFLEKSSVSLEEKEKIQKELKIVEYNLAFIENSHAVHNIYYAAQILRKMDQKLSMLGENYKITLSDISEHPLMSGGFCATMCHQKVGVKVPPEFVNYKGKKMPHIAHTEMMPCAKCHEFGSHKEIKMKFKTEDCQACHEI